MPAIRQLTYFPFRVYDGGMRYVCMGLLCLMAASPLPAKATEEVLASRTGEAVLPVDPVLGVLDGGGDIAAFSRTMLGGRYGLAWIERYVAPGEREAFAATYGAVLAPLLPQKDMAFGRPVDDGRTSTIACRLADGRILTLVFRDRALLAVSLD